MIGIKVKEYTRKGKNGRVVRVKGYSRKGKGGIADVKRAIKNRNLVATTKSSLKNVPAPGEEFLKKKKPLDFDVNVPKTMDEYPDPNKSPESDALTKAVMGRETTRWKPKKMTRKDAEEWDRQARASNMRKYGGSVPSTPTPQTKMDTSHFFARLEDRLAKFAESHSNGKKYKRMF